MNVAFVCVNYGSDDQAIRFACSVRDSAAAAAAVNHVLVLVDNTVRHDSDRLFERVRDCHSQATLVKTPTNLGYFGGAHFGLQRAGVYEAEFDYVVVSNVDLQLASSFLSELEAVAVADDVGLIAPSIFSRHRKRDLNPKILHRLSPSRVRFYEFVFSHRGTYLAYHIASVGADLVRRLGPSRSSSTGAWAGPQQTLYAAHGALMIFTRAYFQRGGTLDYPCFLFGEEVWAAEELRLRGLHTIYDPQIKVLDDDHVSTRRLSKGALAGLHASSMRFLRRTYFDGPHPGYPST